ncbi:PD-(D/E)XK motif protein [Pontixanthobacter aquaemixtae]|uniref:PD-(D/E)XK motif protein n=1 Tax=Pontixanthobacter aquaemixtae TaxID=1958940 RepID=A0A845A1I7_9SPHN|nr:PD-(D/E)XK motif protein [Pontixanthobacter aquaemixtae]MXO91509.1 PD-(D/E)XK motif protein [Pontixanthobacter aquaemixtae]
MDEHTDGWSDIGSAPGARTERRADPDHPLDFFRARSEAGNYMLVLKGESIVITNDLPVLSGLSISLANGASDSTELRLELLDAEQRSIFKALVADILRATQDVAINDSNAGAARVVTRIERWRDFLKRRREQVLSRQAILGLFGELHFLSSRVLDQLAPMDAMLAWRGPHGEEQDFAIGGWILEIKTQLSTADQFLKISSEAQLDTASGPILICHQTFSSCPESDPDAMSLKELVNRLRALLLDQAPLAIDILEAGLIAVGYEDRPEYDQEKWKSVASQFFEVEEGFPRLAPSNIPQGIQSVRYRILPAACSRFKRDEAWLKEKIFDA